jgi:hypothetical protein
MLEPVTSLALSVQLIATMISLMTTLGTERMLMAQETPHLKPP